MVSPERWSQTPHAHLTLVGVGTLGIAWAQRTAHTTHSTAAHPVGTWTPCQSQENAHEAASPFRVAVTGAPCGGWQVRRQLRGTLARPGDLMLRGPHIPGLDPEARMH